MQIEQIISNLLESNTYVVKKSDECLIVDAGADLNEIEKKVDGHVVKGLLLTHGHYDHAFNALEISKHFNCKIYASKKIVENLSDPAKNYGENFKIDDFSNFVFLEEKQDFSLGEFEISATLLPGHSKCSMCYLIDGTFFAGDVLFKQGIGRTDLYGGSKQEMLESLSYIQNKIDFDTVASGHGEMSNAQQQKRNLNLFIRFLSR